MSGPRSFLPGGLRVSRVLPIVFVLFAAVSASAAVLAPRRPSDVVTLRSSGAACGFHASTRLLDLRVLPDGTTAPFALGEKQVLVVTGVDWAVEGAPVDEQIQLFLYVDASVPVPLLSDRGDAQGSQVLRSTSISPIVVAGPLCAGSGSVVTSVGATVHGFLAKDR
jgi:hypothetical protein